jgi:hypothetical protein
MLSGERKEFFVESERNTRFEGRDCGTAAEYEFREFKEKVIKRKDSKFRIDNGVG